MQGLAAGLYPAALVVVDFGVGAGLYSAEAPVAALLLALCGLLVLAGAVSSARPVLNWSAGGTA